MVFSPRHRGGYYLPRRSHEFLELLHREVPKRELLRQFFSMSQEPHETVAQLMIQFQDLYRHVADDVCAQHIPDTFLSSLREPLRTTLALTNFANQTIEQVIARVLALDRTQQSTVFYMSSFAEHSTPGGKSLWTSPSMYSLFGIRPSGSRVSSPAKMSDLPVPISHCQNVRTC